jgi:tetratricopeptide (TPR) repeat protein
VAQAQEPAKKEKKVKDLGEHEVFTAVVKETDNNKKLALLNTWKQKYPESDYKEERLAYFLTTYQALGQPAKMVETAKEILAMNPKDVQGLYWITILTPQLNSTSPDALDLGEKSAQALLGAEKPAPLKDEDWKKAQSEMAPLAHNTLGWIAMQRKNNEAAEQAFRKSVELKPNQGQVSYWLGLVILGQKKPERQSEALFHFARAAALDQTQGGLSAEGRQQIEAYVSKNYSAYHGKDDAGFNELKDLAKSQPFPPAGFKIKSSMEIALEKEEELKRTNPQLATWLNIKKELTAPNGAQFFESMKGAELPKLKGKVLEAKPAVKSKELVLGLTTGDTPEVTLKLSEPIAGKPEIGTEIEFTGVATTYTPEPFMLNLDIEKAKIEGLKVEAAAPPARGGAKKSTKKKG